MTLRLAPLAGVSDWPFRKLCFREGCDCSYTEMVSALGYTYGASQEATQNLLFRAEGEKKLIVQLFGKEPEVMGRVAGILSRSGRYDGIDINMGCPVRKVACSGEGSGLMQTPEVAEKIMRAVVRESTVPVSVKMRLGWDADHINVLEMAKRAEDAGVSEITVHGRTRQQMYGGTADWDWIYRTAESVSIPVIGNGDILTGETAMQRIREGRVAGIMIGRGAMGNPWIFREIRARMEGRIPEKVTVPERVRTAEEHYRMLLSWKPERVAVSEMRKHLGWYLHGLRGAARMREKINTMTDPEEIFSMLRTLCEEEAPETSSDGPAD